MLGPPEMHQLTLLHDLFLTDVSRDLCASELSGAEGETASKYQLHRSLAGLMAKSSFKINYVHKRA